MLRLPSYQDLLGAFEVLGLSQQVYVGGRNVLYKVAEEVNLSNAVCRYHDKDLVVGLFYLQGFFVEAGGRFACSP